jgi:hypothetical protein
MNANDSALHALYLAAGLVTLMLSLPALSVELFRYRGAAKDGGTLEYVFEAVEQILPMPVTKEKAAEIAADFMTTFYHVQVGALETQESRTNARSVLVDLLIRHDQGCAPAILLRGPVARWNGC